MARQMYRVFAQDVGTSGYSGVQDIMAQNAQEAIALGHPGWKYIALPHTRKDLWPDPKTGRVSEEALKVGGAK